MATDKEASEWRSLQGVGFPDHEIRLGRGYHRVMRPRSTLANGKRAIALHCTTRCGRQTQVIISDLVAEAFIGPRPTPNHVSYVMDANPDNLHYKNIGWRLDRSVPSTEGVEWRLIHHFPAYEISETGVVRRHSPAKAGGGRAGRIIQQHCDKRNGHFSVALMDPSGRRCTSPIGNLLAHAFHGAPPTPLHEAAHNDGDPGNNHYKNIRWATRTENSDDRILHGTRTFGEKSPVAVLTNKIVWEIREAMESPFHGQIAALARHYGVSEYAVHCVKHGKTWRYIDPPLVE
jgi:hypothetical protein